MVDVVVVVRGRLGVDQGVCALEPGAHFSRLAQAERTATVLRSAIRASPMHRHLIRRPEYLLRAPTVQARVARGYHVTPIWTRNETSLGHYGSTRRHPEK